MRVLLPDDLDQALALLAAHPEARPLAGGTDLMVSWHQHDKRSWTLLDLSRLRPEMGELRLTDDALRIGALATYWQVRADAEVCAAFPLLADAARQVGAIQIQARGTWAGNIANGSPAADGVPVLMAYDAIVELRSVRGQRDVPLDTYYTGYKQTVRDDDELITAIRLPRRPRQGEQFHKVGARRAQAITKVGVALLRDSTSGWRVVANSVAATVRRCRKLEAALDGGATFTGPEEVEALLSADVQPITDIRSTATYRGTVLARILYHALRDPAGVPAEG